MTDGTHERRPPQQTWNDARAIEEHRQMSAAECFLAAIELSRAALAFAGAKRDGD